MRNLQVWFGTLKRHRFARIYGQILNEGLAVFNCLDLARAEKRAILLMSVKDTS